MGLLVREVTFGRGSMFVGTQMIAGHRGETGEINRGKGPFLSAIVRPIITLGSFPRKVPTIFGQIDLHRGDVGPRAGNMLARDSNPGSLKVFRRKTRPFLIFSMRPCSAAGAFDTLY